MFFSMFSTKLSTIKVKENQRFMEFVIKVVKSGVFLFGIYMSVDTSCCSRHIYLRFSRTSIAQGYRGSRKSVDFWGEEEVWRLQRATRVFCRKPLTTKETVAIHYGVPCKSVAIAWQKKI